MESQTVAPEIPSDDFARRFAMRPGQLMWFLGAGVSASANVPTAGDMVWRFKRDLFIAQRKVSPQSVADLADPSIQRLLDSHMAASDSLPKPGSPEEYSDLFEIAYPSEKDRRALIDAMIRGAKLAYGHLALAAMLKAKHSDIVWTTNFDHLLEDACFRTYGTTNDLTAVGLEGATIAVQHIAARRFPLEIKLHGDFRSQRLKNTAEELRHQDSLLGAQLTDMCARHGLIVAGYSGRDHSVMDALEAALKHPNPYPNGLFWLHRGDGAPFPRVGDLIGKAHDAGAEAFLVRIDNFDEIMSDLVRQVGTFHTKALDALGAERTRVSAAPKPSGSLGPPIIRLNGIEITARPTNCRKIVCNIGGIKDVRSAIEKAGTDLICTRTRNGILGFGSDDAFRATFGAYGITEFDVATLEIGRMRYDSQERGLLRSALARALKAAKGLDVIHQRSRHLVAPADADDPAWAKLGSIAGGIEGKLPGQSEIRWREGASIRLEWADNRLWLIVDSRIVFDGVTEEMKAKVADFARERTARRYNQKADQLNAFWTRRLSGEGLRALEIGDGLDAAFSLSHQTAFSRTVQP